MSDYRDIKRDFLSDVVRFGWQDAKPARWPDYPNVPEPLKAKWVRRFYETPKWQPRLPERLLNAFLVGADPEFVFCHPNSPDEINHAVNFQFQQARAFGMDNSGRQVELRPAPSRSTLDVVASLYQTMRWMTVFSPNTLKYAWKCGGVAGRDGLGGHIHFGRKRPHAEREQAALDTLTFRLFHIGVFDQREGRQRRANHYGELGDVRPQRHGYEYRTMPSWLDSPYMAFLSLTLAKLAVLAPELWPPLADGCDKEKVDSVRAKIIAIVAHFKGLDDDAALLLALLQRRGWPKPEAWMFQNAWGMAPTVGKAPTWIPGMIPPDKAARTLVLDSLWTGVPPVLTTPLYQTWAPCDIPKGYVCALDCVNTRHAPGLGETLFDLVVPEPEQFRFEAVSGQVNWVSQNILDACGLSLDKFQVSPRYRNGFGFDARLAEKPKSRERLLAYWKEHGFPIWNVRDVREDSWRRWQAEAALQRPVAKKPADAAKRLWPLDAPEPPRIELRNLYEEQLQVAQIAQDQENIIVQWQREAQRRAAADRIDMNPANRVGRN